MVTAWTFLRELTYSKAKVELLAWKGNKVVMTSLNNPDRKKACFRYPYFNKYTQILVSFVWMLSWSIVASICRTALSKKSGKGKCIIVERCIFVGKIKPFFHPPFVSLTICFVFKWFHYFFKLFFGGRLIYVECYWDTSVLTIVMSCSCHDNKLTNLNSLDVVECLEKFFWLFFSLLCTMVSPSL